MARQPEIKKKEIPVFEFTIKSKSLVKEGDIAVFCFWNKKDESAACYGGIGRISEVLSLNNRRFYVKVQDYRYCPIITKDIYGKGENVILWILFEFPCEPYVL